MTLSGALRDDIAAINAGMYCLMPHKDLSGRQIIYLEPHRHTRQGYSSESMVSNGTVGPLLLNLTIIISRASVVDWNRSFGLFGTPWRLRHEATPTLAVALSMLCGTSTVL